MAKNHHNDDGDDDPEPDDEFVVCTPLEPLPPSDDGNPCLPDGHDSRSRTQFIETRERLAAVEQQVEQVGKAVGRVEEKVDDLHDDVQSVEDNALDEEYFEEEYKSDIEQNNDVATILVWGGGVALALAGVVMSLYSTGLI